MVGFKGGINAHHGPFYIFHHDFRLTTQERSQILNTVETLWQIGHITKDLSRQKKVDLFSSLVGVAGDTISHSFAARLAQWQILLLATYGIGVMCMIHRPISPTQLLAGVVSC